MLKLLLRMYPAGMRDRLSEQLLAFWDQQRHEPRYAGRLGGLRFALAVVADSIVSGMRARMQVRREVRAQGGAAERRRTGILKMTSGDVRHAVHVLRRTPAYTAVASLTLALGIGATSSLFTVVNGVLLRPLPYRESDRLVEISRIASDDESDTVAWPDFRDWRDQAMGFAGMAAWADASDTFLWENGAESLEGTYITRDLFEVLGVSLALGRTFDETEDVFGGAAAIIISDGLWRSRFGAQRDIVGRTVVMNGESVPVVGVAPARFAFPEPGVMYWRPLQGDQLLANVGLPTNTRSLGFLRVAGRLDRDDMPAVADALKQLVTRIDEETGAKERIGVVRMVSLSDSIVGDVASTLLFLFGAVVLVLVVASANVAGLGLSRANARQREMAVRAALGAGRARLFRQMMTESMVLAMLAGVMGIGFAYGLTQLLRRIVPPGLPRLEEVRTDGAVLAFSVLITMVAGAILGLVPALRASRANIRSGLSSASRGSSGSASSIRPQQFLVSAQVALSVVLLAGAALLANSFLRLIHEDRGFSSDRVVMALVVPSEARYGEPALIDAFYTTILDRVRDLPGIVSATSTYSPPFASNGFSTAIWKSGEEGDREKRRWAGTVIIRDDYFRTTGVPLLRGREFDLRDRLDAPAVVIVSEAMANSLWPGEDAIGKQFVFAGGLEGSADSFDPAFFPKKPYTVVGIAGDVRRESLAEAPIPEYYRPHSQITWISQYLLVRTAGDPDRIAGSIREAVRDVDATVPIPIMRTLDSQIAESVATPRFRMQLIAGFAILTCALAMIGLYAVMVLSVQRRTREIGIRLALGARRAQLMRGVLGQGLFLVAAGTVIGTCVAYAVSSAMSSMLYEIRPTDPATYGAIIVLIAGVAMLACYLPARRASRVDPVVSLQEE